MGAILGTAVKTRIIVLLKTCTFHIPGLDAGLEISTLLK